MGLFIIWALIIYIFFGFELIHVLLFYQKMTLGTVLELLLTIVPSNVVKSSVFRINLICMRSSISDTNNMVEFIKIPFDKLPTHSRQVITTVFNNTAPFAQISYNVLNLLIHPPDLYLTDGTQTHWTYKWQTGHPTFITHVVTFPLAQVYAKYYPHKKVLKESISSYDFYI